MKTIYHFIFIAILLTSCSSTPSGDAVQTAIAQTQIAQPTTTLVPIPTDTPTPIPPTPIPLADLDLSSILVQSGDLPSGYSGAQIRNTPPAMFKDIPEPMNQVYQQFEHNNDSAGGVGIFIYDNQLDADNAYNIILDGMGDSTESISNIGVRARMMTMDYSMMPGGIKAMDLVSFRCNTVVSIRITDSDNPDYIISYAQRLDERLTPLVCR